PTARSPTPRSRRSLPRPPAWPTRDCAPPSPRRGPCSPALPGISRPLSWSSFQPLLLQEREKARAGLDVVPDAFVPLGGDRILAPGLDLIELAGRGRGKGIRGREMLLGNGERHDQRARNVREVVERRQPEV